MLFSIIFNYFGAILIDKEKRREEKRREEKRREKISIYKIYMD
jgi:hypothetical protein